MIDDQLAAGTAHEDPAGVGRLLDAAGYVQGQALRLLFEGRPGAEHAGYHFAGVKSDPDPDWIRLGGHGLLHRKRGLAGKNRMVLLGAGRAEDRLQAVAQQAKDRAIEAPHRVRHGGDRRLQPADRQLGIQTGDHFGRTDDIGEQHGRLLALAARFDQGSPPAPRRAAPAAETRPRMASASARRADGLQGGTAARAELVAGRVLSRAIGASHGRPAASSLGIAS